MATRKGASRGFKRLGLPTTTGASGQKTGGTPTRGSMAGSSSRTGKKPKPRVNPKPPARTKLSATAPVKRGTMRTKRYV